jgi:hypothetical protein
MPEFIGARFN